GRGGRARGADRAHCAARRRGPLATWFAAPDRRPRLPAGGAPHRPGVCARAPSEVKRHGTNRGVRGRWARLRPAVVVDVVTARAGGGVYFFGARPSRFSRTS